MEYKVLFAYSPLQFEELMPAVLSRGWRPCGGLCKSGDQRYYQPITRTKLMRLWVRCWTMVSGEPFTVKLLQPNK